MTTSVAAALEHIGAALDSAGLPWALVGGLAVGRRSMPRFTKDVDLAVAVADDSEAERIVGLLQNQGYAVVTLVEQEYVDRLATVRLTRHDPERGGTYIDLLFANSGIEDEVVAHADRLEVLPGVTMPVASIGHLIALKVLAGRHKDLNDVNELIAVASETDLRTARFAVAQITDRGFHRSKDLRKDLDRALSTAE